MRHYCQVIRLFIDCLFIADVILKLMKFLPTVLLETGYKYTNVLTYNKFSYFKEILTYFIIHCDIHNRY
jgi:hypothetical protein